MSNLDYKLSLRDFISSPGIAGFVLLIRPIIMALISRQRDFKDVSVVDSSAFIQIFVAILAFIVAIIYIAKDHVLKRLFRESPLKWFILYTFWCALTSLWSPNGILSTYRAFEALAWSLLIWALLSKLLETLDTYQVITWVLYYAVFDIFVNVIINSIRFGYPITSLNTLLNEQFRSTPYFFLALLLPVGWLFKITILPISIFSLSNTAYAGMGGGLLPLISAKGKWRRIFILFIIIILITISLVGTETVLKSTVFYGQAGIGTEFTTGRDKITEGTIQKAMEKPIAGHGFVAGEIEAYKTRNGLISVHNGFLSALVGTGFIGFTLFLIFVLKVMLTAKSKYLPPELRTAFMASAILITIHTMGNPGLGSRVYGTWFPAMLVFTLICVIQGHYKYKNSEGE